MRFEWDPGKDRSNQAKHGVGFAEAAQVFDDPFQLSVLDARVSYFEERWITLGQSRRRQLLVVVHLVFTADGEEAIRIISAREATFHERRRYEAL